MADSITCPVCNMISYHPKDIEHGWCGNCHTYTRDNAAAYVQRLLQGDEAREN